MYRIVIGLFVAFLALVLHYIGLIDVANNNVILILWLALALGILGLVFFILRRGHLQKKYTKLLNDKENNIDKYPQGQYYYQSPLLLLDKQPVLIHGKEETIFELTYKNSLHKIISLIGLFHNYGVVISSPDVEVKIIPKKILYFHYYYDVYINGEPVGDLHSVKYLKNGNEGMKSYLPFDLKINGEKYKFRNQHLSYEATISSENGEEILKGKRSIFDLLSKNKSTNRRGEEHNIKIQNTDHPTEIWLACYIQIMNLKNDQGGM